MEIIIYPNQFGQNFFLKKIDMLLLNKLKKSIDEGQFLLMLQENQGLHSVTLKYLKNSWAELATREKPEKTRSHYTLEALKKWGLFLSGDKNCSLHCKAL